MLLAIATLCGMYIVSKMSEADYEAAQEQNEQHDFLVRFDLKIAEGGECRCMIIMMVTHVLRAA